MKIEVSRLISLAMCMLVGCATSRASAHECGIDHVKTTRFGLKVYFQPDISANSFSINRTGAEGSSTQHSEKGPIGTARRSAAARISPLCPSLLLPGSGW
jgi:hypothetical protein